MASNTNISVHGTEMEGIVVYQPNTHQMEEPAEDAVTGITAPTCGDSTTAGRAVVLALSYDQSDLSRGKKASYERGEGSRRTSKGKRKAFDDNAIVDVTGATVPDENENLPIEKNNNLLWEVVGSSVSFGLIPQKPHFRPLESYTEIEREGEALSLMILYDKITKKTLNLRLEAPKEDIENDLLLLKKLETHGFDVLKQRKALSRILILKVQDEDIENILKENRRRFAEFDRVQCESKEKRIKMQDEITKLRREASSADLGVKRSKDDSASDHFAIKKYDDEVIRIRMEIEKLVASPLY